MVRYEASRMKGGTILCGTVLLKQSLGLIGSLFWHLSKIITALQKSVRRAYLVPTKLPVAGKIFPKGNQENQKET